MVCCEKLALLLKNWEYQKCSDKNIISKAIINYPFLKETSYYDFFKSFNYCYRSDEKVWFNCIDDVINTSDNAFSVDFFKNLSLECVEKSSLEVEKIESFWNCHFPFLVSVANGYEFYAISKDNAVFHGKEPEFEEVTWVSKSFEDFIDLMIQGKIIL